jgi:hypothetical protein
VQKCLKHLIKQCRKPTARNILCIIPPTQCNSMFRTVQLSSKLFSSVATCSSSLQTEHVYGSVLIHQTEHFQILFSDLKCIVVISFIISTNLLVEWCYTMYMFRHVLAFLLCTPAVISSVLDECIVLCAYLIVSGILFIAFLFSEFIWSGDILMPDATIVVINPLYCKS